MDLPSPEAASIESRGTGAVIRWALTIVILACGGASLAWGVGWIGEPHVAESADFAELKIDHHITAISLGLVLVAIGPIFFVFHRRHYRPIIADMHALARAIDALPAGQRWIDLLLASILSLLLEVTLIRWHGTEFRACAYFKNITLLACFLGLGLGFARARRSTVGFPIMLPLLALQVLVMDLLSLVGADRAVRNPVAFEVLWGLEGITNLVQIGVFYGFFTALFVSTIVIFIPIGQLTGRLMNPAAPIASYTLNIIGSIVGVLLFMLVSYLWLPPSIWFGIAALLAMWLTRHSRRALALGGCASVIMLGWLGYEPRSEVRNIYSPYQRLEVRPDEEVAPDGTRVASGAVVAANKTYYLQALDLADEFVAKWSGTFNMLGMRAAAYNLPYRLGPAAKRVLIVGAGAGNDVAAAVRNGAGEVDAVEIDPAIRWVGQTYHPESPYQSSRVHSIVNDARAFMKRSPPARYDLIIFGLLDSHTLLSGMSAIRLDNFVYTAESMAEARRLLRPGGRLCLSFALGPDGPFSARIYKMLTKAFGHPPRTFALQQRDTLFAIGLVPGDVASPPPSESVPENTATVASAAACLNVPPAEDDWPFPFLPGRSWSDFPRPYIYLIAILSLVSVVWVLCTADRGTTLSARFFFLGAAFLLIETKGITELALDFGTTWIVTSIVIVSILVLILLANWLASVVRPQRVSMAYVCLFLSLLAGYFVPPHRLLDQHWLMAATVSSGLVCLPLFFAGIIFAVSLRQAPSLPSAFASNLLGAILGGLCEYGSMIWGFRALYLVAMGLYALSWFFSPRRNIAQDAAK